MGELGAARAEATAFTKSDKPAEGLVIELGLSRQVEASGEKKDHWREVELVLEMWERVARSWENDTLLRLVRYARLEAETERDLERRAR